MLIDTKVKSYVQRDQWILSECYGKRVLDLGVVAMTCSESVLRVKAFKDSLHFRMSQVASQLTGVDYAEQEILKLNEVFPSLDLRVGSVEALSDLFDEEQFEVVVMGNLIEHLSNPGLALDAIRERLCSDGELIITCPNAFGAPSFLRFMLGKFREGDDHVLSFSKYTLARLLDRHGFRIEVIHTGIDNAAKVNSLTALLGTRALSSFPELGGTLIVKARVKRGC